ncbi:MAG TPA: DUF4824 family protein, partial [Povalibacter sp.]|nr:DUF4824 family protein [Povalibacter sp.]
RYPDRSHYAIVGGRLRIGIEGRDNKREWRAYVEAINVDRIRVPVTQRAAVLRTLLTPDVRPALLGPPRYAATVNFGRRFEPWITDVAPL